MYVKWKLVLVHLDIVLLSAQDSFTVFAEYTMGLKSFWTHPMVHQGDMGQAKAHFDPFGDILIWCKIGARFSTNVPLAWKSLLGTPDGPRYCMSSESLFRSV
jgi:hypothetical protein